MKPDPNTLSTSPALGVARNLESHPAARELPLELQMWMDVATVKSLLVAASFALPLAGLGASAAHVPPSTRLAASA